MSIDDQMNSAVRGVQDELLSHPIPEFSPSPKGGRGTIAVVLVVLGCAGLWLARSGSAAPFETATETATETVTDQAALDALLDVGEPLQSGSIAAEPGEFVMPLTPSWNADGSLFLVYRTVAGEGGRHEIFDGSTLELVRSTTISPNDIEQVFWSPVDPSSLFYFEDASLMRYDVLTFTEHFVEEMEDCGDVEVATSPMAWDAKSLTFSCVNSEGQTMVSIYQFARSRGARPYEVSEPPFMLASGQGIVITEPTDTGFDLVVLDTSLTPTGVRISVEGTNLVATRRADGTDVLVGPSYGGEAIGSLVAFDLSSGRSTVIVGPATGYDFPPSGTHVSAQPWLAPGLVALSILGDSGESSAKDDQLSGRVLLIDLGSGEEADTTQDSWPPVFVQELAVHNSSGETVESDYWASTFLALDPTGQRIVFSSDQGSGTSVATFLVSTDP